MGNSSWNNHRSIVPNDAVVPHFLPNIMEAQLVLHVHVMELDLPVNPILPGPEPLVVHQALLDPHAAAGMAVDPLAVPVDGAPAELVDLPMAGAQWINLHHHLQGWLGDLPIEPAVGPQLPILLVNALLPSRDDVLGLDQVIIGGGDDDEINREEDEPQDDDENNYEEDELQDE